MYLLTVFNWIDAGFLQAVSRTLLHSVWQGLLLAVATAIAIQLTKRVSANVRYWVFTSLLLLSVAGVGLTFYLELQQASTDIITDKFVLSQPLSQAPVLSPEHVADATSLNGIMNPLMEFCDEHALLIVLIWFVIFCIKCSNIMMGFGYIRQIRQGGLPVRSGDWQERVGDMAVRLGIRRRVSLMESARVRIPIAVGFLKPCILVPLGLLIHLPANQAETILLHELAHIHRKDYFINILQNLIEMVFFFNPGMLWLSSRIRQERENCCDDIVVSVTHDKMRYINALVSFQELHLNGLIPVPALAFSGNKFSLLDRVRRLAGKENFKFNTGEKTLLVISLVVISSLCLLPGVSSQPQQPGPGSPVVITRVLTTRERDSTNRLVEATDKAGVKYKIISINKTITAFYLNGNKQPLEKVFEHKDLIKNIDDQSERQRVAELKRADSVANSQMMNEEQARREGIRQDSISLARRKAREAKDSVDWAAAKAAGDRDRALTLQRRTEYDATVREISADLIREHFVKDLSDLSSFILGKSNFIVNGKKEPFEVYDRYRIKYLKSPIESYSYNYPADAR